ncbi:MAG: hypothetical protein AABW49_04890 [Nanoarchaeota archaeon]
MGSYIGEYRTANDPHYFVDNEFYVPQSATAATTSIQTANQLGEVNARLNAGISGVDIQPIQKKTLQEIPKQHFTEIHRLAKLSNANISMHGPLLDMAGFTEQGFHEEQRYEEEKFLNETMNRAHLLNPKGNTVVNMHINTGVPGEQWEAVTPAELKDWEKNYPDKFKLVNKNMFPTPAILKAMGIVEQPTGKIGLVRLEEREWPEGKIFLDPEHELRLRNKNAWDQSELNIFQLDKEQHELNSRIRDAQAMLAGFGNTNPKDLSPKLQEEYKRTINNFNHLNAFQHQLDEHIGAGLNEIFNKLQYTSANKDEAKKLLEFRDGLRKQVQIQGNELEKMHAKYKNTKSSNEKQEIASRINNIQQERYKFLQTELGRVGKRDASGAGIPLPEIFTPANNIAEKNTIKTVANVAMNAYKKFKENAPVIAIENYQPHFTLGNSEDLKRVIVKSREEIQKRLMDEAKLSKEKAQEMANKMVSVNWDVGHINFLKAHGFSDDDVLKETEKIAPFVTQLHITDNFGFHDAHMPPGFGDSPIEEQFKLLKKAGFKFEKGNTIIEAGSHVAQFKENPHVDTIMHFESPLYSGVQGPTWNEVGMRAGGYSLGFGNMLPDVHFRDVYGAGWTNLPRELGGGAAGGGDRDRFSGTPMQ